MYKSILLFLLLSLSVFKAHSQDMDNEKLSAILYTLSDEIEGIAGNWQFSVDSTYFICITDENNNRMRIIAPIIRIEDLTDSQMADCMEANFHTALDVRYAISDDILWSAFIHPLKELTKEQVFSGLSQVYSCVRTFGTTYSSGALNFPKAEEEEIEQN